jgi:hypothetical protein
MPVRTTTVPTFTEIEKAFAAAYSRWLQGKPTFREMARIRRMTAIKEVEGQISSINWFDDMLRPGHEAYEPFTRAWAKTQEVTFAHLGKRMSESDLWLHAVMQFGAMKCLEISDSPSWFSISEGLALRLLTTEITNVHATDVRVPFSGFLIEMPPGLLFWDNEVSGRHEVRAVCVAEGFAEADSPTVKADIKAHPGRRLLVTVFCEARRDGGGPSDDNVAYFTIPLFSEDLTVTDMIAADQERVRDVTPPAWLAKEEDIAGQFGGIELTHWQLRDLFRQFVINTLLYINSPNADLVHKHAEKVAKLKKKAKTKKLRKVEKARITRMEGERHWLVGSRVKIDPTLKRAVLDGVKGKGSQLRFKSLVRGHWRNQAYGPGRTLRRLIWIEPHVRGGDLEGEVLGHQYDIQKQGIV